MELVAPQHRPRRAERCRRTRHRGPVAEGQSLRHLAVGGHHTGHRTAVEAVGQPEQSAALGPDREAAASDPIPDVRQQSAVVGQRAGIDLGEAPTGHQTGTPLRKAFVPAGIERDELGTGRGQRVEVVLVGEAERRPGSQGHAGRADRFREAGRADNEGGSGRREAHDTIEIAAAVDRCGQRAQRVAHRVRTFGDGHEAEVAVAPGERVVAAQDAEDGDAEGFERGPQQELVAGAADPVENDAGDADVRVKSGETMDDGGHRLAHRGRIDHEHDGRVEEAGDVGGR